MKFVSRLLLIVVVFALLYEGMSHVIAASADGEGPNVARWFLWEFRRSEALQLRAKEVNQSMEIKADIINELLAGRLTLREAASQFHAANALVEADHDGLVADYRLPQTEEEECRQVLAWTQSLVIDQYSSEEAKQILDRLERELDVQFPSAKCLN